MEEAKKTKEEVLSQFTWNEEKQVYIHRLADPIKSGSETITEFHLKKPRAKHIRNMSTKPSMSDVLDVIGKLAGQERHVIDELDLDDMNKLSEYFAAFS